MWEENARAMASRLGVSADEIAVDVHRGDGRLASEVTSQQMWAPVIQRLRQIEEAVQPRDGG